MTRGGTLLVVPKLSVEQILVLQAPRSHANPPVIHCLFHKVDESSMVIFSFFLLSPLLVG